MKKLLSLSLLCLALGISNAQAQTGTTNPALFNDTVDWCQFGCAGAQLASPQAWTSTLGNTGVVGLVGTLQGFYNLQQDVTWGGNFADNMGVVYNGAAYGNTPTDIAAQLDEGVYGVGAYIEADWYGPFSATISLYDGSDLLIGSYSTTGYSAYDPGTALFIGAYISNPDVWAVQFDATGIGPYEPDFAIGTMGLMTTAPIPEPSTLLLMGPSLLGLFGYARRRVGRK